MSTPSASFLAPARPALLSRVRPVHLYLAMLVVASTVVRALAVLPRSTPRYLPDEYLYPQLARSLGNGHGIEVLGQGASLPALLEPLLTAPFWRSTDAATAMRLTEVTHSLLMALAVIPVYLIAVRLRLPTWATLATCALTVLGPGLLYAGYLTADATGYLVALVAIHAALRALDTRALSAQWWFVATALLATFARLQYAALVFVFLLAATILEGGRPRAVIRRFPVVSGFVGVCVVAAIGVGARGLGRYEAISTFSFSAHTVGWTLSAGAMVMAVTGAALAPGAIAWCGWRSFRTDDRSRRAFAIVALSLIGILVVASALMSDSTGSDRFFERYLLVAYPLVALCFGCWISDGRPGRLGAIACSAILVLAAARVPVADQVLGQGSADSPTLLALSRLSGAIGIGNASLVAALAVTLGAALAFGAALSPRVPAALLVAVTAVVFVGLSAGAHVAEVRAADRAYSYAFLNRGNWIDARAPGKTLMLQTPGSSPYLAMVTSVWNSSIDRAAPLGVRGVAGLDGLSQLPLYVDSNGVLRERKAPVRRAVAFATDGSQAVFERARSVVADRYFTLVVPRDLVRLRALAIGVRSNGTLAPSGELTAFPTAGGECTNLVLRLTLPPGIPEPTLQFRSADGTKRTVPLRAGRETRIVLHSEGQDRVMQFKTLTIGGMKPDPRVTTVADARIASTPAACTSSGS